MYAAHSGKCKRASWAHCCKAPASRAQDDTYAVVDYIQSRDALRELNKADYIANAYGDHGDFVSRFSKSFDNSFEALLKYYRKHVVSVDFDSASAITTLQIRAYTAQDAEKINESLLELSEGLVNRMNDRAANDTVRFAQKQVDHKQPQRPRMQPQRWPHTGIRTRFSIPTSNPRWNCSKSAACNRSC